jgi:hypothetical protein
MRRFVWAVVAGAVGASGVARAEPIDTPSPEVHRVAAPPPIEIGVSGFLEMGFGNVCQTGGDVTDCSPGAGLVGVALMPRWRVSRFYSLGVLGALGTTMGREGSMSSDGAHQDLGLLGWRIEAEARVHPIGESDVDPWFGADFGLAALTDSVDVYGPGGHFVESASATQLGPIGAVAFGVDFRTTSVLALGFELRGGLQSFDRTPPVLLAADGLRAHEYGTLAFVSLGLGGTFLVAP